MRLLNVITWRLESFDHASCIPPYIALSYCWFHNESTCDYRMELNSITEGDRFSKLWNLGRIATSLGMQWIRVDSICVNQTSNSELTDAGDSNFSWLRDSDDRGLMLVLPINNENEGRSECLEGLLRPSNDSHGRYSPQTFPRLHDSPKGTVFKLPAECYVPSRTAKITGKGLVSTKWHHFDATSAKIASNNRIRHTLGELRHSQSRSMQLSPTAKLQLRKRSNIYEKTGSMESSSATGSIRNSKIPSPGFGGVADNRDVSLSKLARPTKGQRACDIRLVNETTLQETDSDSGQTSDDDMSLFGDLPHEPPRPSADHPFTSIKSELTKFALVKFWSVITPNTSNRKRVRHNPPDSARKRLKSETNSCVIIDQTTDSEDEDTVPLGSRHAHSATTFACPYYVRSPTTHQRCLKQVYLRDISEVKQHIWRDHRRPPFCPVCRTIFDTHSACDAHIIERGCTLQTTPKVEGISYDQMQLLTKRLNSKLSAEQQWFAIWDIAFPGEEHPEKAYISDVVGSTVDMLREHWSSNAKQIIKEFLNVKNMDNAAVADKQGSALEWLFSAVLAEMMNKVVDGLTMIEGQRAHQLNGRTEEVLKMLRRVCIP